MLLSKVFFASILIGTVLAKSEAFKLWKKASDNVKRRKALEGESHRSSSTILYRDLNFVQSLGWVAAQEGLMTLMSTPMLVWRFEGGEGGVSYIFRNSDVPYSRNLDTGANYYNRLSIGFRSSGNPTKVLYSPSLEKKVEGTQRVATLETGGRTKTEDNVMLRISIMPKNRGTPSRADTSLSQVLVHIHTVLPGPVVR